jgi:hypothetical protein
VRHHGGIDVGGEHRDAAGQADDGRHLESLNGADEDEHGERQQRRQRQRQRDPPQRGGKPRPAHARCLLQLGIGVAQARADQEKGERRPEKALDQDHAGQRIDVEQHVGRPGERAVELVDRSGLAEHEEPGADIENVGRAERDDGGEIGERLPWRVGALDDEGVGRAEHQRQRGAARGEQERITQRREELPGAEHAGEIVETKPHAAVRRGHRDAALQQEDERRQHEGA